MGILAYNGKQPIPEPRFKRNIDISADDFDGTDTANMNANYKTQEANGSKFNPWIGGFLLQSHSGDGWVNCVLYDDYRNNGKVIDDALAQPVYLIEGDWSNDRVIKILSSGAGVTDINIGI